MFKPFDRYGDTLDSYDVLKLIALGTMVVDHLGAYFWPDAESLRAVGRMAFPLFLFLVGYSGAWKVKRDLLLWAGLIVLCAALTHHPVFPLNILVTIAAVRYAMGWLAKRALKPREIGEIFIICIAWFPLFIWLDYGTFALLFAVCGYLQRERPGSTITYAFLYATLTAHCVLQYVSFRFHAASAVIMILGIGIAGYLMQRFHLRTFAFKPGVVRCPLQWAARNTLPLYGLHVMLFMVLARLWFPERLAHFQWI